MERKQGVRTSDELRSKVIGLYAGGSSFPEIRRKTVLALSTCHGIVGSFVSKGSVEKSYHTTKPRTKITDEVLKFIEYQKTSKPSIYAKEIHVKLLQENVCTADNVPSVRTIQDALKNELGMSYKLLGIIPAETTTAQFQTKLDNFLSTVLIYKAHQLHFFDEASVIRTAGHRRRGHAFVGEPAVEVQKYASNATYTVILCCGFFGVDYFNVIDGPSNANIMINFFGEALEQTNSVGNPVFLPGDCVIMDNCGFHHQRFGEAVLRNMLAKHGVELIFLPPYSPELNPAEFIFKMMRDGMKKNLKTFVRIHGIFSG
ncbi:uncharacterized protein LOC117332133 [Pecten maximus]|uniref:uncharacterized protein LOC117332133 n=1 Tax=Pecten maximus TaxID=6579 RepID=UPI001458C5A5|nr:uncharacterized protein LOC117332133 [Pecten maximus]